LNDRPYNHLIFDWDGTLMDSAAWIIHCMQHAIDDEGLPYRDEESIRGIIGLGLQEAVQQIFPETSETEIKAVCHRYREHYFSAEDQSNLFEGVIEVLDELRATGYWLAIATGKSRRGLARSLKDTGLESYFAITRTADETMSKPHPMMLDEIMMDFDASADECLMIGDSLFDLQMASNAGMESLAVSWGVQSTDNLASLAPSGLIHDIREMPAWLKQQGRNKVA
jgi:phosphoglycolate phosphatase